MIKSTNANVGTTTTTTTSNKSQYISRELHKFTLNRQYPFLNRWKILCFEFYDDFNKPCLRFPNTEIELEFELSDQIYDLDNEYYNKLILNNKDHATRRGVKGQEQTGSDQQKVYENENEAYSFLTNTNSTTSASNTNNNMNANNELYRGYDFSSGSLDSSDDSDTNDDETGRLIKHDSIRGDLKWNHTLPGKYNDLILQILDCKLFQYDTKEGVLKLNGSNFSFEFDEIDEVDKKYKSTMNNTTISSDDGSEILLMKSSREKICLICKQTNGSENYDKNYDFSSMFNDEFFSDFKIKTSNGHTYYVHKSIIWLTLKDKTDTFLSKLNKYNFDSDLIELVLFYCYCDCLPSKFDLLKNCTLTNGSAINAGASNLDSLNETKLKSLIEFLNEYNQLNDLNQLLKVYMNNFSFKLKTDKLLNEIKNCFEIINNLFRYDDNNLLYQRLFLNPSKLCQVLKASLEQLYLGIVKVVRLFDMYSSREEELSKDEKSDFIKKVKNSLPFFLCQWEKFLNSIHKHSLQLNDLNKHEIADYMIPEIDRFVFSSLELIRNSESVIDKIVKSKSNGDYVANGVSSSKASNDSAESGDELDTAAAASASSQSQNAVASSDDDESESVPFPSPTMSKGKKSKNLKTKLGKTIKNAMHLRELKKIQKFNNNVNKNFKRVEEILLKYEKTNQDAKSNLVYRELNSFIENIVHDIPRVLRKLNDFSSDQNMLLNRALKIYDFKFTFKVLASKTEWFLNELKANRQIVNPYINDLCNIVQNAELNKELERLNLAPFNELSNANQSSLNWKNNDLDSFFKSKSAHNNRLSSEALNLFKSKHLSDICLEIHDDETNEVQLMKVHGAIVASRCVWFQRALSSGMKESIDRKVILHDRNLNLFTRFIEYLYSGNTNETSDNEAGDLAKNSALSNDELVELLTFADKYECDSLKDVIENKLVIFIKSLVKKEAKKKSSSLSSSISSTSSSTSSFSSDHDQQEQSPQLASANQPKHLMFFTLIDYASLGEHFNLKLLVSLCVLILVEYLEKNASKSNAKLDECDEFKQLSADLQEQIKHKRNELVAANIQRAERKRNPWQKRINHNTNIMNINNNMATSLHTPLRFYDDDLNMGSLGIADSTGSSMNTLNIDPITGLRVGSANDGSYNTRLEQLISLASPLIVLDAQLLESSFVQLKEIIDAGGGSGDDSAPSFTDEQLVKLLIRNDCDLNRVVPIALNID